MEVRLIKPFGPSILKAKIPNELVYKLNDYAEKIIDDNNKNELLNHGNKLAGDVTQEFKLESDFAMKVGWVSFLGKCVQEWINLEMKKKIKKFTIIDSWIVRQFKNEYNPIHWHGGHVSGAGFLKIPKNLGNYVQDKGGKPYKGGKLNLIHGSRQFLSNSTFEIKPEVGDFYFFPSYLMHTVYPFKGNDAERRSISFNALIDEEIHNVYASR
jgi:hypothetical protein|tara:strand:- start:220 stop:855 length:636 start_codon:yes stop_codon:yes gene_type:complete